MNYDHRQLRTMAGRLAELFESEEGERILRLVTQLSAPPNKAAPATELPKPGKPADTPAKLRVGTWEAVDEANGRSFVRVATGEAGYLWANVQKIPPKGPGRCVVLVGESVARMMQLFLDIHIRRVPTSLCRSYDQLFEFQIMATITGFYNDSLRDKFLNTKLITAISEGLEEFGIPTQALVKDLIIREHGIKDKAVNLVHNLYSTGSFARSLVDLRPGFFKATARNTTFPLVCDKPESLSFALTKKVPR
jgi:hypothetical protein